MREIPPPALRRLGQHKIYRKKRLLFGAQDNANGFYYVESGEIRVYKMDEQGKELEVVRLGPGDFLAEAIVFVSPVFPFFAQAVVDSDLLFFDKETVLQEIEKNPQISKFFLNLLARKCLTLSSRIESLGLKTVRQRLIQHLISSCSGEKECLVELKVKKAELAKMLGTIGETISRNFKQMQDEGLIEVRGNKIYIKNCQALREELIL